RDSPLLVDVRWLGVVVVINTKGRAANGIVETRVSSAVTRQPPANVDLKSLIAERGHIRERLGDEIDSIRRLDGDGCTCGKHRADEIVYVANSRCCKLDEQGFVVAGRTSEKCAAGAAYLSQILARRALVPKFPPLGRAVGRRETSRFKRN